MARVAVCEKTAGLGDIDDRYDDSSYSRIDRAFVCRRRQVVSDFSRIGSIAMRLLLRLVRLARWQATGYHGNLMTWIALNEM